MSPSEQVRGLQPCRTQLSNVIIPFAAAGQSVASSLFTKVPAPLAANLDGGAAKKVLFLPMETQKKAGRGELSWYCR